MSSYYNFPLLKFVYYYISALSLTSNFKAALEEKISEFFGVLQGLLISSLRKRLKISCMTLPLEKNVQSPL